MAKVKAQPKKEKAAPSPLIEKLTPLLDKLVYYYREGWRAGYLVELTKNHARVRPIVGGKNSPEPNCLKVAFDDIKEI